MEEGEETPQKELTDEPQPKIKKLTALQEAENIALKIKAENDRFESLLVRQEKVKAEVLLGGLTDAGQAPPALKEETEVEYAKKIMGNEVRLK